LHAIVPSPTSVAVFIGYTHPLKTLAGNDGKPVRLSGFADYQRQFGGVVRNAAYANAFDAAGMPGAFGDLAQGVMQFFLNGGTDAYVVSVNRASPGSILDRIVPPQALNIGGLAFTQLEVTDEAYLMCVVIRPAPATPPPGDPVADIVVSYGPAATDVVPSTPAIAVGPGTLIETYRGVSLNPASANYILRVMSASALVGVSVSSPPPGAFPDNGGEPYFFPVLLPGATKFHSPSDFTSVLRADTALDGLAAFNLMVLPGIADNSASGDGDAGGATILAAATAFCERKRAFLIMDPPVRDSADGSNASNPHGIEATVNGRSFPRSRNAALYFPYLLSTNPIAGSPDEIPPAATVAGIYAATDAAAGVWKAPAGLQARTADITGVVARGRMTDQRQGVLNQLGVNCLRDFASAGTVVFGARTLATTQDQQWRGAMCRFAAWRCSWSKPCTPI
jgi:hypothetical protein